MNQILVVVDMQKDFVSGVLGTQEAQAIVGNVCGKIRAFDGEILVTLDTHDVNYLQTQEGKYLPVEHCIKDTDGWQLAEEVKTALWRRKRRAARWCILKSLPLDLPIWQIIWQGGIRTTRSGRSPSSVCALISVWCPMHSC